MLVEVIIKKSDQLPIAFDVALKEELERRLNIRFSEVTVRIKRGANNSLSVLRCAKGDKDIVAEILQETWESADEWFDQ